MSRVELAEHFMIAQNEGQVSMYPLDEWNELMKGRGFHKFTPRFPISWYVEAHTNEGAHQEFYKAGYTQGERDGDSRHRFPDKTGQ